MLAQSRTGVCGTINIKIQRRKIRHSFGTFHLAFSVSSVFWAVVLYHLTYFLDTDNSNGRLPIWKENRTKIQLTPPCKGCKMTTFVWVTFWLADRLGFYQSSFRKPSCPQRADWWKVEMQFDRWRLKVRFHRIMKIAALFREDLWSASVKSRSQIPLGALTTLHIGLQHALENGQLVAFLSAGFLHNSRPHKLPTLNIAVWNF
mgnify:FL=1